MIFEMYTVMTSVTLSAIGHAERGISVDFIWFKDSRKRAKANPIPSPSIIQVYKCYMKYQFE